MAEPATSAARPAVASLGYQPALDGLRAVAITLVILFHTNGGHGPIVPGGYLGVDVFFVLSGFLITSLLLDEHARDGLISLRRFWARRVARLAPLLLVIVAFAAFIRWVHPIGNFQAPTPLGFLSIFGYVGNWVAASGRDSLGSFQYVWSLAVEEQFYLVWPLAILGLAGARPARTKGGVRAGEPAALRRRVAVVAFAGAAVAMLARLAWWQQTIRWNAHEGFMLVAVGHHRVQGWNDWFFSTGLRADGLLLGAGLAATRDRWTPWLRSNARAAAVGLAGMVVAAWIALTGSIMDNAEPEWALALLVAAVAVTTAAVVAAPANLLATTLACKPLVWLGQRSYALYLLHLPVLLLLDPHVSHLRPGIRVGLCLAVALVAADLAHRFVELPAQRRLRRVLGAEARLRSAAA